MYYLLLCQYQFYSTVGIIFIGSPVPSVILCNYLDIFWDSFLFAPSFMIFSDILQIFLKYTKSFLIWSLQMYVSTYFSKNTSFFRHAYSMLVACMQPFWFCIFQKTELSLCYVVLYNLWWLSLPVCAHHTVLVCLLDNYV